MWTIAAKDLHSELRTKEAWNASIAFSVVILLLFSFAFDPSSEQIREFSGGLLWMTYAFAGALVLNRSFARETAERLPGRADRLARLLRRAVRGQGAGELRAAVRGGAGQPAGVRAVLQHPLDAAQFWPMLLVLVLGTWALTVIGTLFSALTVNLRLRELMLPTLVYPMMIPALIAAMTVTTNLLAGNPLGLGNTSPGRPSISSLRCWPWFL